MTERSRTQEKYSEALPQRQHYRLLIGMTSRINHDKKYIF